MTQCFRHCDDTFDDDLLRRMTLRDDTIGDECSTKFQLPGRNKT